MRPRAKIISSRQVFTGPVFGVRHDVVVEPDGLRATRDVVTHHGSVVVMPIFRDRRILLVRQYRHSVGRYLWELTAGRIEPGESPLEAARRELREETGYAARRFRKLLDLFPTPGFVSESFVLYAAEGLSRGKARPDTDERITWRLFRVSELLRLIHAGRLRDAKSVAGILYYARFVRRPKRGA